MLENSFKKLQTNFGNLKINDNFNAIIYFEIFKQERVNKEFKKNKTKVEDALKIYDNS